MRKSRFALLSSAIALITSTNAFAQDATPQTGSTPAASEGDIIVTAQFREQNLQDTPIAITAVNSAMLEARSQTDISQVANQAPSVTLKPQGAAYGPALGANIRGVGQFDFNPALEPGVGFYVDDVYYATLTGSILDLLDLDRVEVLRGPQGTLAGRNSIGGAVKLYSQKPEGTNTGYVAAAYGSRNRIDLRGSADFNIAQGIDMRLAGVAKKQEGYVTRLDYGCVYPAGGTATLPTTAPLNGGSLMNPVGGIPARTSRSDCVLGKEGEVNYIAARGQLRLRPSETLDINIIADYTDDDRQAAGSVLLERYYPNGGLASPNFPLAANPPYTTGTPATASGAVPRDIQPFAAVVPYDTRFVCGPYCNYATYDMPADGSYRASTGNGRVRFKGWGVSGQIDWEVAPNLQINSITAYREYESNFSNDNDVSPLAHSLGYGPLTFRFFSQELRLNGSINDQIDFTLGGYYSDQKSVYTSFQDLRSSALQFQQSDPVEADSKALFAHISWNPVEPLTLTGGIRYTEEAKTYTYIRQRPYLDPTSVTADGVLPLDGKVSEYSGNRVDYRANIQYALTPDVMAYAQFSTGFKGGGVNPRPFFVQQALSFDAETLNAYEIGFKTDLFDRVLRLNVAAFLSKYKDIQLSLGNCTAITGFNPNPPFNSYGTPCALPVNAGDADIKGLEVEATLRPVEGMSIDGAISYIDFTYKRFGAYTSTNPVTGVTSTVSVGGPTNLSGPQFGDYAPYTPEWKWSLGVQYKIDLGTAGSLTPRVDGSYQSKVYTVSANRSSNRIDAYGVANARLTWRNADEDLDVSFEVTNLFDEYYLLTIYDQTVGSQGYSNGQPGRPREWAVSVKKKF